MSKQLKFIDGLRGLAALYVAIGHARWLLWEGYSEGFVHHPEAYPLPAKLLMYFLSTFIYGHQMVMFFFVLSGFVIHLRYSRQIKTQSQEASFDWLPYVIRRARRLYPPLILAMLLTLALDMQGHAMQFPIYTQSTLYSLINTNVGFDHSFATAAGTLAFIPGIHDWGTNGPLWSLHDEWWFYVLYPAFWLFSKRSIKLATLIMLGAFVVSLLPSSGLMQPVSTIFSVMIIWWFGALLADTFTARIPVNLWQVSLLSFALPLGLLFALVTKNAVVTPTTSVLSDVLWGIGFTGFLAACLAWQRRGSSLGLFEVFKPLGDFSYTLYVTHFPILVFISGYLMSKSPTLPRYFDWFFLGMAIVLSFAYVAHWIVEKPVVRAKEVRLEQQLKTI